MALCEREGIESKGRNIYKRKRRRNSELESIGIEDEVRIEGKIEREREREGIQK